MPSQYRLTSSQSLTLKLTLILILNSHSLSTLSPHRVATTPKVEGVKKRSYTEDELAKALQDIQSGRLGTRRAAALYKIPRSTLRNKVHKMNNVDGKKKPVQSILPDAALSLAASLTEPDRNGEAMLARLAQSTSDQSPTNDALRELLRKSIYFKEPAGQSPSSNDLDGWQELKQKLEFHQMINNLANLNTVNNGAGLNSLGNSLLGNLLSNNSLLDTSSTNNSNLLNDALTLQLLNSSGFENMVTNLKLQLYLMRQHQIITDSLNNEKSSGSSFEQAPTLDRNNLLTSVVLDESINSVLSNHSGASSALKNHEHSADNQQADLNDDTRSSVDKFEKSVSRTNNLERQPNGEHIISDDSNQSVIALDEPGPQELGDLAARQRPANLSESMNSTSSSLNLANNQFSLLNSLNLSTLQTLANPLYPLNQFNLASLAGGNLNNLNLGLNLNQPAVDPNQQPNQQQQSSGE